ncbi:Nif3-like dinuclear metal center hexameric protein [Anaerotalea alkaliphila]|uniref:GTP cyclohydrolase 1 type 2 homolog n=1 Tax=Anaerotalea alkaliphila TaxID=2662126 RepID=A0A7X5HT47_9FIRM|nr:Nif3-like dinuclear metal center hexameric protein [Anaerotalea alkaliphila]NDL66180.1 Nif3-like dinuclear metal center hexameric protein [Anaerotalea alkaliphila]
MATTVMDFMEALGKEADESWAMEWDNVGLFLGDPRKTVEQVFFALDPTLDVIREAGAWGADLLVTHHPLAIRGVKDITTRTPAGRKILAMMEASMAHLVAHTNFDVSGMGMNVHLAQLLGLDKIQGLGGMQEGEGPFGLAVAGELKDPLPLSDLVRRVKSVLGLPHVRYAGDGEKAVRRVGICTGSGMGLLPLVEKAQVDAFITGDLKYHDALDAVEEGRGIIDATHFGTEHAFRELMAGWCGKRFPEIRCAVSRSEMNPIQTI